MAKPETWYWLRDDGKPRFGIPTPREIFLRAVVPGDAGSAARGELVKLYMKDVFNLAFDKMRHREDAKEIVQEFCLAFMNAEVYTRVDQQKGGLRNFIKCWVEFAVLTLRKKRSRGRAVSLEDAPEASHARSRGTSAEAIFDMRVTQARIDRALQLLRGKLGEESDLWRIFDEVHLQIGGDDVETQDQMAARLGVTRQQVRDLIARGRWAFQRCLADVIAPEVGQAWQMQEEFDLTADLMDGPLGRYWMKLKRMRKAGGA